MATDEKRNECCRDPENMGPVEELEGGLTFRRCAVCRCRHFELTLEPGEIALEFKAPR